MGYEANYNNVKSGSHVTVGIGNEGNVAGI